MNKLKSILTAIDVLIDVNMVKEAQHVIKASLGIFQEKDREFSRYKDQYNMAMTELDRLGIPISNTFSGSLTLYGRLKALEEVTFKYKSGCTPVFKESTN